MTFFLDFISKMVFNIYAVMEFLKKCFAIRDIRIIYFAIKTSSRAILTDCSMLMKKRRILMKLGNKAPVFALCLIIMVAVLPIDGYAFIKANDSDKAFMPGGGNKDTTLLTPDKSIRDYIIDGAAFYLDSYSNILALLKEVEVAELGNSDGTRLSALITSALDNMENCNAAYISLHAVALQTEYNPVVILELKTFNYNQFMSNYKLNRSIFRSLQDLLHRGDVRGAYSQMLLDSESILAVLYRVKSSIDQGLLPDSASLWEANQAYSESLLFGQYMAAIFAEIVKGL